MVEKEGTHAQGPDPLSTVQEEWKDQPRYQIFKAIQIGHRLDMMYATHSGASPRLQCPTCVQAYVIPVGWRKKDDDGESSGPKFMSMFLICIFS